ncbi:class 3 adenylate cyclase [Nocardia mexicana]|uniref:Class 3 adenylate cyclase n=2 Tax=Nocardia mexicana TaxID=279262 RepID=A0A370GK80_9NOCA|nr:class 3 adenylate cyclase [Nocardia mexicana]
MAIIGNPPTDRWLSYAGAVSETPSGDGENAPRAADADGSARRSETDESRAGGSTEPGGGRRRIEPGPDVVIPLTPADSDDAPRRPAGRLRAGQLSSLMAAANQRPDVIGVIRRARENLPGDPAFGDPLSVSGPGGPRAVARAADKLVGDTPNAAKEIGLGALQVWQAMLERVGRGKGTQQTTVMFTDLVAFSSWSLSAGDEATLELLRRVAKAIEPPIVDRGGRVVKRMGDGVMAVFPSPDRAVQAAVSAKENLCGVEVSSYKPQMRIGLHTGNPREIGGDWLGVDVTIAARVMEAGGNGNTMLSAATLQALQPETLAALGHVPKPYRRSFFAAPLSGVPEDLRIYRLDEE